MGNPRSSANLFTINPSNPQQVLIKNTTLTFLGSGNIHNSNDPDLQYFINYTIFDKLINNLDTSFNFLNVVNYIKYGDKKSMRYYFIKDLIKQYYQQSTELSAELSTQLPNQVQGYAGSGLNGEAARSHTNQYVFLPSDPDDLVDQLKLFYFEKLLGNDNP